MLAPGFPACLALHRGLSRFREQKETQAHFPKKDTRSAEPTLAALYLPTALLLTQGKKSCSHLVFARVLEMKPPLQATLAALRALTNLPRCTALR